MNISILLIGLVSGMLIGGLFTYLYFRLGKISHNFNQLQTEKELLQRTSDDKDAHILALKQEQELLNEKYLLSREESIRLNEKSTSLENKIKEIQENNFNREKELAIHFQNMANKIFDDKSEKFDKNSVKLLDNILNPLKEKIQTFESKVEKIYSEENRERINLKAEVKQLTDLNKQLSKDANNLTTALKGDNKAQGNWGELILERVLENSGLEKGREYNMQYSEEDEFGRPKRPDVVVKLPEDKHIIIDAKVSIVSYERYVATEDNNEKQMYLKEHIQSVRNHIKSLSEKNYQGLERLNAPDFVLMFMPIEAALGLVAGNDENLWTFAWEKKIVLVSPATLLATLRTVSSIWKHENQNINAIEIATQAGRMLDKFTDFTQDMLTLGRQMDTSKKSYENAMRKLSEGTGNLVKRSEKLKELGVKAKKQMDGRLIQRAINDQLNSEDV